MMPQYLGLNNEWWEAQLLSFMGKMMFRGLITSHVTIGQSMYIFSYMASNGITFYHQ